MPIDVTTFTNTVRKMVRPPPVQPASALIVPSSLKVVVTLLPVKSIPAISHCTASTLRPPLMLKVYFPKLLGSCSTSISHWTTSVAVGVGVLVLVGVLVGDGPTVGVLVAVLVAVGNLVFDGVGDGPCVGVRVGVLVGVAVLVLVGVKVGKGVEVMINDPPVCELEIVIEPLSII